jgi:hypothetical protein
MRLGVVTFGPSGGASLAGDLRASLPGVEVTEQGLLDGLSESDLDAWQAGPGSPDGTVVHLRDGREVTIESAPLLARVPAARGRLAAAQPHAVVYGCAGPVPRYPQDGDVPAVHPREVTRAFVTAACPRGRVGFIVPSPLHVGPTVTDYGAAGRTVDCRAVSPADREAVLATVAALARDGADLVILGCFDHTLADLGDARAVTSRPVVSSRLLAIDAVRELLAVP